MESIKSIKCVVVGDGAVGKTSLLYTYTRKVHIPTVFHEVHVPTVYDNYSSQITMNSNIITLDLWDTAGIEDYDRLRPLSYPESDVCIICFSVCSPASHANITRKWYPEISQYCPKVPIVLVGTKKDQRQDPFVLKSLQDQNLSPITEEQGRATAREIKAVKYLECSALHQEGIKEIFEEAVNAYLKRAPTPPEKSCVLF